MQGKTVYLFDGVTRESKGIYECQACPVVEGEFITPTDSTAKIPPAAQEHEIAVWNGVDWEIKIDRRGQLIFDQITAEARLQDQIGAAPQGWAFVPPPKSLAVLAEEKNAEIDRAWAAANMSKFTHGEYVVGCDQIDRMNIDGVAGNIKLLGVFPAEFPGIWKARNAAGEVAYIPMTETAQFCAMYADMTAQGSANFAHAQALKTELAAATTKEQIDAITW